MFFFFFFPFLGQKTYQVRFYNTQNLSQFQSIQQQNLSHTQTAISKKYQAKCFSNLSQFQSISLTKFEEVQMFKESSIQQHKYTNVEP